MARYVIEETKLGIQKISKAILREVDELDEEMENIYEITFSLKIKQDGLYNGIEKATLQHAQDDQVFLGIREGSLQAFWTGTDGRKRIRNNQNLNQAEYVEVQLFNTIDTNIQHIEIKWMFNDPEQAASHFEFEFKLLTKVEPQLSYFYFFHYDINTNLEQQTYQDLEFATIDITDREINKFSITQPITTDPHASMPNIQDAGNPNAQMKRNPKFELTSAEIHVISYYGSKNESEKILCIVSSKEFGVVVHCLNKSSTIGDLRSLIVCTDEHKNKYLMTEKFKRPYRADKKLSDFGSNYGLNDGCIFFRFQENNA